MGTAHAGLGTALSTRDAVVGGGAGQVLICLAVTGGPGVCVQDLVI